MAVRRAEQSAQPNGSEYKPKQPDSHPAIQRDTRNVRLPRQEGGARVDTYYTHTRRAVQCSATNSCPPPSTPAPPIGPQTVGYLLGASFHERAPDSKGLGFDAKFASTRTLIEVKNKK